MKNLRLLIVATSLTTASLGQSYATRQPHGVILSGLHYGSRVSDTVKTTEWNLIPGLNYEPNPIYSSVSICSDSIELSFYGDDDSVIAFPYFLSKYDTLAVLKPNGNCWLNLYPNNGVGIELIKSDTITALFQITIGSGFVTHMYSNSPISCGEQSKVWITVDSDGYHSVNAISNTTWNIGTGIDTNTASFSGLNQFYTAYITLINGCHIKDSLEASRSNPNGNLLCFATVDTNSVHTIIAFDTNGTSNENIDSVFLYYYNSSNTWQKIGSKSYSVQDTAQYFVDTYNNPNATPQLRYAVRTIDQCGVTSSFSNYQQTMYINSSGGTFSWSGTGYQIEGNSSPVITYYLFRNDTNINSVSGSDNVIVDPNYSPTAIYWVEAKLNESTCNLTPIAMGKHAESVLTNSTRSIKLKNGIPISTGVASLQYQNSFKAYPNPFVNTINVDVQVHSTIELLDVVGRQVFSTTVEAGHNIIPLNVSDGMYFLRVNGITVEKMVK